MQNDKPGLDDMYCYNCGNLIKRRDEYCMNCGVRVSMRGFAAQLDEEFSEKSRLAAGLLGIFVGEFGIHRFYLGNIGIGIIQIIVTLITMGIGGLWGFIEGIIIIANGSWRDAEGKPLKKL